MVAKAPQVAREPGKVRRIGRGGEVRAKQFAVNLSPDLMDDLEALCAYQDEWSISKVLRFLVEDRLMHLHDLIAAGDDMEAVRYVNSFRMRPPKA